MSDRDHAIELLEVAARDLNALRGMGNPQTFADEVFGFIVQQAVEKTLKAWLCLLSVEYPLTHDLTDLLARLRDTGQDVDDLWDLAEFNPFAVELRYSALSEQDIPIDRDAAVGQVEALLNRVRELAHHS